VNRLCERPGCSQPAAVAYGFDADHLIVWLDAMVEVQGLGYGVLCRRHADAMVVPLGWMLDDRRELTLRLFKTPDVEPPASRPRRDRPGRARDDTIEQLRLAVPPDAADSTPPVDATDCTDEVDDNPSDAQPDAVSDAEPGAEEAFVEAPWVPAFDARDDLHGLLKARGRLLSRAFNGVPTDPS
jgi:hypothetical protein